MGRPCSIVKDLEADRPMSLLPAALRYSSAVFPWLKHGGIFGRMYALSGDILDQAGLSRTPQDATGSSRPPGG